MAGTFLLHLLILWLPAYNTLVDFPFHLGRAYALYMYDHVPFFQTVFVRSFDPMPNLAIDLIVPPLLGFMTPVTAGKVFLSMILVLFAAGCHWLGRAIFRCPSMMAPVALFAVFNSPFLYGFVNSSFSTALFLVTFALWLTIRDRWSAPAWLALTTLATATYIAHLSGFVFLAIAMGICWAMEFLRTRRSRLRTFTYFCALIPAVLIQLWPWANKVRLGSHMEWGTPFSKVLGLASVFLGYRYDLSVVSMLLMGCALALALFKGAIRFERTFLWLGIAFVAASIICPTVVTAGGGYGADARFIPPGMVFLFLSCAEVRKDRTAKLAFSIAFGAMLLHAGDVGWHLYHIGGVAQTQMAALSQAAPGSRIYDLFLRPKDRLLEKQVRSNLHLPSYSPIVTGSVSSDFYAARGVQPLYFRHPEQWNANESPSSFDPAFLDARLPRFDYVWGCNLDAPHLSYIRNRATLIASGDTCGLWKLQK